jgi:hypothetical protein
MILAKVPEKWQKNIFNPMLTFENLAYFKLTELFLKVTEFFGATGPKPMV